MFAAVMVTGVVANVVRGNYLAIPLVCSALLLAVAVVWAGIWLNRRRIQLMFRNPTPDRLIESYHATLLQARARKIPNADAAAAHLSALAATVYGQFDRAREELAAVDWEDTPAMYRRNRLYTLGLIALLEKHDEAGALRMAAEARALEGSDPAEARSILADVIQVATGECDAESVKRTERAAARKVGALPALSAWALSRQFDRAGQQAEAAQYRGQAREAAPHFVGLATGA